MPFFTLCGAAVGFFLVKASIYAHSLPYNLVLGRAAWPFAGLTSAPCSIRPASTWHSPRAAEFLQTSRLVRGVAVPRPAGGTHGRCLRRKQYKSTPGWFGERGSPGLLEYSDRSSSASRADTGGSETLDPYTAQKAMRSSHLSSQASRGPCSASYALTCVYQISYVLFCLHPVPVAHSR